MQYFALYTTLVLLAVTFILERRFRERLFHSWRERLIWIGIFFVIGAIWDAYAISHAHWVYERSTFIGVWIGVIPLEDFLWLIAVPYFSITIYKIIHYTNDGHHLP